ncbi:hypothetical protein EKO27_g1944 [Xylaria grammica]|uniref:Uncharacterized protein n=1 Tax=Xylaria grammica TaxID=363999 RepID=A0A439DFG2_9PEZI|nr:hypothetical protein EKO27_g1944 [Xylaria grammica]
MHRYLIRSAIALFHVTTSATPHNINLLPRLPQSSPGPSPSPPPPPQPPPASPKESSCLDPDVPRSFSFHEIAYLRYEVSPTATPPQPNTTQLVFELVNENTGVSTGCACQNVMSGGAWVDDSRTWYACLDRAIAVGDARYPVKTSALVDWDAWRLTVNQTWVCDER